MWVFLMVKQKIDFIQYKPEYALEIVKMWRLSFQRAMGVEEHNRFDDLNDQLNYFLMINPNHIHIMMDTENSVIAGFMVLNDTQLDQLYIHVNYQSLGLGSKFIEKAKKESPNGLELHTFQKNKVAQNFYWFHGFKEIERGHADFIGNPWAKSKDDLADIKFKWSA